MCHQEDDKRSYIEHTFHNGHHRRVLVHTSECFRRFGSTQTAGQQIADGMYGQENGRQTGIEYPLAALLVGAHHEIGHEQHEYHGQQRELGVHIEKL